MVQTLKLIGLYVLHYPSILLVPVGIGAFVSMMIQRVHLAKVLIPRFDPALKSTVWMVHFQPSLFPTHVRAAAYALLVLNRGALIPRMPKVLNYDFRGKLDEETIERCRRYRRTLNCGLFSMAIGFILALPALWEREPSLLENGILLASVISLWLLPKHFRRVLVPRLDPLLGDEFDYQRVAWHEKDAVAERTRMYAFFVAFPPFYRWRLPRLRRTPYVAAVPVLTRWLARFYLLEILVLAFGFILAIVFHR